MDAPAPPLDAGLTRKQKARLHEVADLMLQIYQTLVRARCISAAWIQRGPHDLTAQLPLYHSLGLDARVIYLYSILPYLSPQRGVLATFFNSSGFIDFRDEDDVRQRATLCSAPRTRGPACARGRRRCRRSGWTGGWSCTRRGGTWCFSWTTTRMRIMIGFWMG